MVILVPGVRPIGIELKWGRNTLDDDQKAMHRELSALGWGMHTAWSVSDVCSALRTEGVTLRLEA
ncbi:MAG: hypothetical protein Q7O66_13790 [Dehalococcoidia bacterium]|nr:hypothetical protein [Dehalococcoidia bacterium]